MQPITLLAFALGAHAACKNLGKLGDFSTALCVDEDTGIEFEYIDMENHLETAMAIPSSHMADAMYEAYITGRGNVTQSMLEERDLTTFWNKCKDKVSGVCANDHVIAWTASLSAFSSAIIQMYAAINHANRLDTSPRSQCTNYKNKGTICISWAAYYANEMTQQQVRDIANQCAEVCEQQNNSCEARVVTDSTTEYHCVSNRATHCEANGMIRSC